jgi:NAD(P)-dependent dehydrogenase (short-subunit alcohol dehydrogenase family)
MLFRRADEKTRRFDAKVALVTGAASGIGRALAEELARRGAEVVLADRQAELLRDVARGIEANGGRAWAEELDVRDLAAFEAVVARVLRRSERIDLLFNNAGIAVGGEAEGYAPEDWTDVFDVNLRGVANGVQAVYPHMISRRSGSIVNTASVLGLFATPGQASYTASKHAVVGMSKVLRVEARAHGVNVSVLCPGAVWTPILSGGRFGRSGYDGMGEEVVRAVWSRMRPISPERFAARALDAVAREQAIIVVPEWWKAFWLVDRLAPETMLRVYEHMLVLTRRELSRHGVRRTRSSRELASER